MISKLPVASGAHICTMHKFVCVQVLALEKTGVMLPAWHVILHLLVASHAGEIFGSFCAPYQVHCGCRLAGSTRSLWQSLRARGRRPQQSSTRQRRSLQGRGQRQWLRRQHDVPALHVSIGLALTLQTEHSSCGSVVPCSIKASRCKHAALDLAA